jgi:2'-5' RNA ligase
MEVSALLVPMSTVEKTIEDLRHLNPATALGLPAHVTLLYPFAPTARLDEALRARLRSIFASHPRFEVEFRQLRWFDDDVLWLAPEDPSPFVALTQAVQSAYPEWQPYAGVFDALIPHLTVADNSDAAGPLSSVQALRAAETALAGRLPIRDVADRVLLMAGSREPDSWRVLEEFRLA